MDEIMKLSNRKPRILFIYRDRRAEYLVEELRDKVDLLDALHVDVEAKEPFFWANLLLCALDVFFEGLRKGRFTRITRSVLGFNYQRRPAFVKELSSRIDRYINSIAEKPDFILQWSPSFAPYIGVSKIPFALIVDAYTEVPTSPDLGLRFDRSLDRFDRSNIYQESWHRLQKELYCNAKRIFTLSKWCKQGLAKAYNIPTEKIVVAGWGPAQTIDMNKSCGKKPKTILAVGNDYRLKGFDILVKCAEYLRDFSITIVGEDSQEMFKHFDVPENVRVLGFVTGEPLVRLYSESELFFNFSRGEAAGFVLWEAQAYGCVVVGYDAYGISEAVVNNKTGILLKTRDPILVAKEVRKLCEDKPRLANMRKSAMEHYRENGTWDRVSQNIISSLVEGI